MSEENLPALAQLFLEIGDRGGQAEDHLPPLGGKADVAEGTDGRAVPGDRRERASPRAPGGLVGPQGVGHRRRSGTGEKRLSLGTDHLHLAGQTALESQCRHVVPGMRVALGEPGQEVGAGRLHRSLYVVGGPDLQPARGSDPLEQGQYLEQRHQSENQNHREAQGGP